MSIHSTAIIEDGAQIGQNVEIGPYSIIGSNVVIANDCKIGPYVNIQGSTTIGKNNKIMHCAIIGKEPQDVSFNNSDAKVVIGDNNVLHEFVGVHLPTKADKPTKLGDNNYFMTGAHVAHDCEVGNNVIMGGYSGLAGHCVVKDYAYISSLSGIHQNCAIGRFAFVSAGSMCRQDVPPFILVEGTPTARARSLNIVGLKRAQFDSKARTLAKKAFKFLYMSDSTIPKALDKIEKEIIPELEDGSRGHELITEFVEFVRISKRGVVSGEKIKN